MYKWSSFFLISWTDVLEGSVIQEKARFYFLMLQNDGISGRDHNAIVGYLVATQDHTVQISVH
jgi:hypothetical protein